MADLVLGLAKSAVDGTLTAAKSAIEEEEKLKKNMQRDLILIKDEFEMMRSFLNVAKERATDEMVSTLVRQVRNMALDVEDCIEWVLLTDLKNQWWRRLLPYCILSAVPGLPAAALGDAVAKIELLKSRVEAMGLRNQRYMHIGNSGSKPTEKMHQQVVADATALGLQLEARNAKANDGGLIHLINKINDALPLQVMSVWGAAGELGVASIIKNTCDDPGICKNFSCRAWVKLMHPFNPHEFIRSLLLQFYTNYYAQHGGAVDFLKPADVMSATQGLLIDEFMKQMNHHRYLVFLEDVPSTVDWEAVRVYLPDKNKGSCIVVHTQKLEVASLCVGHAHRVLELEQFSAEHSVFVFFNEAIKMKRNRSRGLINLIKKDAVQTPLRIVLVCEKEKERYLEVAPIIKKTCDEHPEIRKYFKYRATVKLMHPFNHDDFISRLLTQLCENYCPQHGSVEEFLKLKGVMNFGDAVLMKEFVKQVMSKERYLVFLEDLSSKDDLDAVREFLPDKNNGSCIVVVHTQQLEVSQKFSADHTVTIFFNETSSCSCFYAACLHMQRQISLVTQHQASKTTAAAACLSQATHREVHRCSDV